MALVPDEADFELMQRSWTLPVLALTDRPRRSSAIKSDLATITDRALSGSLHRLEARAWLRREIDTSTRVPRRIYCSVNKGFEINRAIRLTA